MCRDRMQVISHQEGNQITEGGYRVRNHFLTAYCRFSLLPHMQYGRFHAVTSTTTWNPGCKRVIWRFKNIQGVPVGQKSGSMWKNKKVTHPCSGERAKRARFRYRDPTGYSLWALQHELLPHRWTNWGKSFRVSRGYMEGVKKYKTVSKFCPRTPFSNRQSFSFDLQHFSGILAQPSIHSSNHKDIQNHKRSAQKMLPRWICPAPHCPYFFLACICSGQRASVRNIQIGTHARAHCRERGPSICWHGARLVPTCFIDVGRFDETDMWLLLPPGKQWMLRRRYMGSSPISE